MLIKENQDLSLKLEIALAKLEGVCPTDYFVSNMQFNEIVMRKIILLCVKLCLQLLVQLDLPILLIALD